MTVLDRIEVDVINVPREITFITDSVFPESPLPKCQLTIGSAIQFKWCINQRTAEMPFNAAPAALIIEIAWWQREDRMQMIGKYHDSVNRERTLTASHA